jgi:hypothetical protein
LSSHFETGNNDEQISENIIPLEDGKFFDEKLSGTESLDINKNGKKSLINKLSFKKATAGKQEKKYFKVDKNFVLFDEIKSLIIKAQILYEKDFTLKIIKAGHPKLLILTGIFVNNPNSIVDVFLVGKFDKPKFLKVIKELEEELGREVNYTIMDVKEFKYRRDITDVFLYSILEGKKFVIIDEMGIA